MEMLSLNGMALFIAAMFHPLLPSKHALTGPIQDLNGQVRVIRANLALINPVWDLYGLPVSNPHNHALINPVWDLYVFARMISATTSPYRSCTGSVWVCPNLQQGCSPKRRETHWRRRLAPTLNNNWHGLCFIRTYLGKYATVLINNW